MMEAFIQQQQYGPLKGCAVDVVVEPAPLGTGGAIRGITLAAFHLPKNIFIATSAVIDLGVDSSRAMVYLYNGYFDKKYIILIPFLILISVFGSAVGKWVLQRTSEKAFRYLVLLLIMATSVLQSIHYFST
jgi:uncharacterized membrane protein YfcA